MAYQFTQTGQELQNLIDRIYQIAEEYDPGTSYVIGDYCSYGGKIYRCTAATSGTFDSSAWTDSVIVMDAIKSLKTRITTAESDISTAQGDISSLNTALMNIGSYLNFAPTAAVTVPSATYTNACSITLTQGSWLLLGRVRINSVTAGKTFLAGFSPNTTGISTSAGYFPFQITSSGVGYMTGVCAAYIVATGSTTRYLVAYQDKGSNVTLSVSNVDATAIRIA